MTGDARIVISGLGGRPFLRAMSVRLKDGTRYLGDEDDAMKRPLGILNEQTVYFKLPEQKVSTATDVEVTFEMNSDTEHLIIWPLGERAAR